MDERPLNLGNFLPALVELGVLTLNDRRLLGALFLVEVVVQRLLVLFGKLVDDKTDVSGVEHQEEVAKVSPQHEGEPRGVLEVPPLLVVLVEESSRDLGATDMPKVVAGGPQSDNDAASFLREPECEAGHDRRPYKCVRHAYQALDDAEDRKLIEPKRAGESDGNSSDTEEEQCNKEIPLQVRVITVDAGQVQRHSIAC